MFPIELISSFVAIGMVAILISPRVEMNALLKRMIGSFIFLIAVGVTILNNSDGQFTVPPLGLPFVFQDKTTLMVGIIALLLIVADYFAAGNQENIDSYPPIRTAVWTPGLFFKSIATWGIYLTCYEMVFRGVFFFPAIDAYGLVPALVLNAVVCSIAHLLKSKREALVSIPMGLLMCYIAWVSGSFWYAAFLHTVLAVAHEIFSIRANPNMRFNFSVTQN